MFEYELEEPAPASAIGFVVGKFASLREAGEAEYSFHCPLELQPLLRPSARTHARVRWAVESGDIHKHAAVEADGTQHAGRFTVPVIFFPTSLAAPFLLIPGALPLNALRYYGSLRIASKCCPMAVTVSSS